MTTCPHAPCLKADVVVLRDRVRLRQPDGRWVDVRGLSRDVAEALAQLDGSRTTAGVSLGLSPTDRDAFEKTCAQLTSMGLWADRQRAGRVAVLGNGPLGQQLVEALRPHVAHIATDTYGSWLSARRRLKGPGGVLRPLTHWSELSGHDVDLVLVASATVEPDRAMLDHLVRTGLPHLLLRAHHDVATVGPFVDGNVGSCVRCHDLMLTDADQLWPDTVGSLSRCDARPESAVLRWAIDVATPRVWWFIDRNASDLHSTTLQLSLAHPGVERVRWPVHAECNAHHAASGEAVAAEAWPVAA